MTKHLDRTGVKVQLAQDTADQRGLETTTETKQTVERTTRHLQAQIGKHILFGRLLAEEKGTSALFGESQVQLVDNGGSTVMPGLHRLSRQR